MFRKLKTIISMMIIAATLPLSAFANGTSGQSAGNVINMSDANPADNPPTATFNIQSATWSSGTEADHNCTWDGTILTLNDGANIAVTGAVTGGRRIEIAADAEAKLTLDGVSITNVGSNNPALLLHDGASLTLTLADASINTLAGGFNRAGIQVHAGRTLTINGTGTLNATGSSGAGIGGAAVDGMRDGGNITINGGTVFATGAGWNSGIGGGSGGNGGNITINGGIVTATGNNNGAGIGGGNNGNNGGAITINGGTVTATGHSGSAGIGGGHSGSGGTIIINDGTVNATGGDSGGAGIGGGASASGGNITINGGSVTATGNRQNLAWTNSGAGIGGGMSGAGGTITITGGTVRATSSREGGAGIGGGGGGSGVGGTVSITGGVVTATGSNGGAGIGGGGLGSNNPGPVNGTGTLGLNGNGVVFASSIHPTGANLTLTRGILFIGNNGTTYGNVVFTGSMTIRSGQTLTIQAPATLTNNGSIQNDGTIIGTVLGNAPFQVLDLSQATPTASTAWTFNNNVYTFLNGANVRVTGSNEGSERRIEIAANATATVTLDGATIAELDGGQSPLLLNNGANLTLTLAAGTINTLTAGNNRAGIQAPQGTTLTINGTGTLNARGGGSSAGIGGADIDGMRNGGVITISGGIVNATGGSNGAGIGGGFSGDGGNITINGGTVSATGGGSNAGAGIGGGLHGNGGTINITGGTVTASAIGTGIGAAGNASGSNTTITISGGAVNATGNGISGVGIGGGWTAGSGGNIVISGGTVVATGSNVGIGATGIGTFTLNGSNAFVSTNNFHAATTQTLTRGILHIGNNYTVYGAAAFTGDMTVQSGQTLTVMTGAALTNNGSIEILAGGTITNNGSITGNVVYFDTDIIDLGINRDYRAAGNGWTFENNVYTILHGATVTVTGNNGAGGRRIEIAENATAAVTLNGVTMFTRDANQSPLLLNAGAILNLTVTGTNYLTASGESAGAGIQVPEGTTITVNGTGTLYVKSDEGNGAGIGGGNTQSGGNITINSGTVDARGSGGGAGIGGGNGGNGGTVTINGGGVTAIGSFSGAGIGGGLNGTGGTVTITGGTVSASGGGAAGAGIGGGRHGDGGTINITGGTVTATGNNGGAGIGGGGRFAAGRDGDGAAVTITGGTVSATGHGGAGIGGGGADGAPGTFTLSGNAVVYATSVSDIDTTRRTQGILFIGNSGEVYGNVTLAADLTVGTGQSIIMRRGGSITVPANVTFTNNGTIYGFVFGTVIGSGTLIEPTANIDLSTAPAYNWGVGWDFANNVYTILDGANVTVTGSNAGSERRIEIAANATATVTLNGVSITGLGDNQSPLLLNNGANLTLILEGGTTNTLTAGNNRAGVQAPQGTTLTINGTGTFNVTGGVGGAGIGGGAGGAGGTITINGGTINATGGSSGAGIGGGAFGSGGIIAISGGTVIATRGAGGAGIGGGVDGAAGTFTLNGNAVVYASSVQATGTALTLTRGVLFVGNNGTAYGNVTLAADLTIASGQTLTAAPGGALSVAEGKTLTNDGTIIVPQGVIGGTGAVTNNGLIKCEHPTCPGNDHSGCCYHTSWGEWLNDGGGKCKRTCNNCTHTETKAHSFANDHCNAACADCNAFQRNNGEHTPRANNCTECENCTANLGTHTPKADNCTECVNCTANLGTHTWTNATCTTPKTCSICQATEGAMLNCCPVCGDVDCQKPHTRCNFCNEWDCKIPHRPCPRDPKCDKGFDCTCQAVSITNVDASTGSATGIRFAVNPVSDVAEISVVLPDASTGSATEISVVIYDMTGNVVWMCKGTACLARSSSADKANLVLTWDLRNTAGRFVANGTYLVIAEVKDRNGRTHRYSAKLGVKR